MSDHVGGCLCGAVRYRLASYVDAGYCHCSRCRKFTGAPVSAWALAPAAALRIESGTPAAFESRRFCAACGSSLYREVGDSVAVCVGTLDDPNAIAPRIHQCVANQLGWLQMHDLLPWSDGAELTPIAERHYLRGPVDPAVTRESDLALREITTENLRAVLCADVAGSQRRFVAPNSVSIAQGLHAGDSWQRAICAGDTVVGFVMAAVLKKDEFGLPLAGDADLWRFMIDSRYQGLGLGWRALELIVAELRTWPGARNVWLSCVPGTGSAYELYRRFGFIDTGVIAEGETFMRLPVSTSPT
jgi:ribosomal protein S18 acetylase RimI-like enzyme